MCLVTRQAAHTDEQCTQSWHKAPTNNTALCRPNADMPCVLQVAASNMHHTYTHRVWHTLMHLHSTTQLSCCTPSMPHVPDSTTTADSQKASTATRTSFHSVIPNTFLSQHPVSELATARGSLASPHGLTFASILRTPIPCASSQAATWLPPLTASGHMVPITSRL